MNTGKYFLNNENKFTDVDELKLLLEIRSLERNIPNLIKKYGTKECPSCSSVKINCFPFISQGMDVCTDCENMYFTSNPRLEFRQ